MAVGMIGTTSSTAIDPIPAIAAICQRESLWLHVDAAYAGPAAIVPELRPLFAGWEQADSIVINPHKWMMTPFDASLLLTRRMETLREAMSLMPEYLKVRQQGEAHNYHEYGIQLGRRFRALKLWMQIRHWGVTGIADRLREHVRLAQLLARWIESEPGWELLAPTPFSTVCFRNIEGRPATWNQRNEQILERVNQSGRVFLSHTKLAGTFTLRVALGNVRQELRHVEECWQQLRRAAAALDATG
jgi:aromatic-L-amino-acid decarboxylase